MLQDEGKLSVDDPVEKHLPEFKDLKTADGKPARVTIRHLLTHTSGMGEISAAEARGIKDLAGLIPLYVAKPVQFEPGTKWAYCQSGINTAARIVEVVSGVPFDRVRRAAAVRPAGDEGHDLLSHRGAAPAARHVVPPDRARASSSATAVGILYGKAPTSRDRFPAANGGLFSTAPDYARFCQMILNGGELEGKRYLKPESVKLMTSVQTGDLKTGFTAGQRLGPGLVRRPRAAGGDRHALARHLRPWRGVRHPGVDRPGEEADLHPDGPAGGLPQLRRAPRSGGRSRRRRTPPWTARALPPGTGPAPPDLPRSDRVPPSAWSRLGDRRLLRLEITMHGPLPLALPASLPILGPSTGRHRPRDLLKPLPVDPGRARRQPRPGRRGQR